MLLNFFAGGSIMKLLAYTQNECNAYHWVFGAKQLGALVVGRISHGVLHCTQGAVLALRR